MTLTRDQLIERRDQALRDLADLERQRADGEIDPNTATRLRERYEAEAAAALDALAAGDARGAVPAGDARGGVAAGEARGAVAAGDARGAEEGIARAAKPTGRGWRRGLVGVAAGLIGAMAAGLLLPRYLAERPAGGFVTGNEAAGSGRDLAAVTNEEFEQVVAANPDVVGMRLALARRYLEGGDYRRALDHYRQVLHREPNPEALANVGWILYRSSDDVRVAARFVEESLQRDPDSILAAWFLANIRLDGLGDPDGAAQLARRLLARRDLQAADRRAVEDLLDRATAADRPPGRRSQPRTEEQPPT